MAAFARAVVLTVVLVVLVLVTAGRPVHVTPADPTTAARALYWSTEPQTAYFKVLLIQLTAKLVHSDVYVYVDVIQV